MPVKLLSKPTTTDVTAAKNKYNGKPITDIITNGFFTVDHKWTVTYWNKAAEKLLSVQSKDIIGKNLWEEFAHIIPLNFYVVYHKAFLHEIPVHFNEYWGEMGAWFDVITYNHNESLSVSFKSSIIPAFQRQKTPHGKQLNILNELYRYITEVTNDCLWEWDFEAKELFWIDGGHERVFGYPIQNALIPQSFWERCVHPDDLQRITDNLEKTIEETGSYWDIEYRFKKSNGEYAHVHDRGHIIYEPDQKACRMIGATQDITSRKTTELQLLESERKLALIARQMVNAVVITDAHDRITWVNQAFTRFSEYDEEEVMGKKPTDFLYGKEADPGTLQYLKRTIKERQPFNCELLNLSKSGRKYWMHLQGQPLVNEKGIFERYFTMATDITDKVLLENKLVQERKSKQREITDAVLTAHENERADIGKELHDNLNQILGATKLYIELAKTDETKRDMALEKSSGYIVTVIEEIRKISKALAPPGMMLGLFENINSIVDDFEANKTITLSFTHETVNEDDLNEKLQLAIFRIVQEQTNNILKHAHASSATIDLSRVANDIILVINDNGIGCDITKVKKGVGIINIRSRAELYGGNVRIVSMTDNGYELKVVLPLYGGH
jgi:PAS domain S-box-containing protein